MPAGGKEIFETGQEPDFTIDDIARVEPLKDGTVRLYIGSEWQGGLRVEYSVRVSKEKCALFGRLLMVIAAEVHNCEAILGVAETAH
jgi:hypothetical protein